MGILHVDFVSHLVACPKILGLSENLLLLGLLGFLTHYLREKIGLRGGLAGISELRIHHSSHKAGYDLQSKVEEA